MYRDENNLTRDEIPRDEMLLDVCLEEVLSGQTPPDLTAQIMAALQRSQSTAAVAIASPPLAEPPLLHSPVVEPPVQVTSPSTRITKQANPRLSYSRRHDSRSWMGIAVAAGVLGIGLGFGLLAWQWSNSQGSTQVAKNPTEVISQPTQAGRPTVMGDARRPKVDREQLAANPFSESLFGAGFPPVPKESDVPWPLPYSVEPQSDEDVVHFLNDHLAVRPTRAATIDDDQWCQRVFQQILGREPSSDELVDFVTSVAKVKRQQLVEQLLTDERYREEYAAHWSEIWTNELLGATTSPAAGQLANRDGLQQYLRAAFLNAKPYDELTEELIVATGSNQPGDPSFNGATNFVLSGIDGNKSAVAAKVSRVFLGHQGQCAQCHDNATGDGLTQQQFWQLAAFFQQATPERDEASGDVRLVNSDFVGSSGDADEAELFFDTADHQRKMAYPVFIDGTPINPDGRIAAVDRRRELAELIVRSEAFSTATVNQYWTKLLGKPVDETPSVASRRQLLQGLSEQFAAHDFDQRQLLKWIVLSEANSRPDIEAAEIPLYENVAVALRDVSRQGRPIAFDEAVLFARVAPSSPNRAGSSSIFVPAEEDPSHRADAPDVFVKRMNKSEMAFANKVQHVFLRTLARNPTREELSLAQQMLSSQDGNSAAALDDLWWAITNSAEYAKR